MIYNKHSNLKTCLSGGGGGEDTSQILCGGLRREPWNQLQLHDRSWAEITSFA